MSMQSFSLEVIYVAVIALSAVGGAVWRVYSVLQRRMEALGTRTGTLELNDATRAKIGLLLEDQSRQLDVRTKVLEIAVATREKTCPLIHGQIDLTFAGHTKHFEKLYEKIDELRVLIEHRLPKKGADHD